jgi:hypothetical protein
MEVKSWSCKPNVTEIADGINGEDRDRLDVETNFYELSIDCFLSTAEKIQKLLDYQSRADEGGQAPDASVGLSLKDKTGGKSLYKGQDVVIGSWNLSSGGRTDRLMLSLPLRCSRFDLVA